MKQAIAYYRVSTSKQGKSGLGLEAQQNVVEQYCRLNDYGLLRDVIEVRSTRKHRAGLFEALALCRQLKATLIVARLDRLGRDVEQIAGIVKSNVEIVVTDNPHANRFTIHILAAVAEEQRQRISDTTKVALDAAKRRGVELGKNGKALSVLNRQAAEDFASGLFPVLKRLRNRGIISVRAVSKELNKKGVPTFRTGGKWHPSTVYVLMNRLNKQHNQNDKTKSFAMQTATINDILFDDLAIIKSLHGAGQSSNALVMGINDCTNNINDCTNNLYERETAKNLNTDNNSDCSS